MTDILYIEDDLALQESVTEILSQEGFNVTLATNGKDALKLIKKIKYDLVLSDIMLPDVTGFDILTKVDKQSRNRSTPFIFASGLNEVKNIRKGMELGADDYIPKPFSREELLNAISARLKRTSQIADTYKIEIDNLKKSLSGTQSPTEQKIFGYDDSFFLTSGKKSQFVFIRNIALIKADKDYTVIFIDNGKSYYIKKTLKAWNTSLPENHFLQIHRSTIININQVSTVEKGDNYSYKIFLKGHDEPFLISQRFSRKLKGKLRGI